MEGIHIVAFAEEDDPGRRPLSSLRDYSPSLKTVEFHVLCLHCGAPLPGRDGESQPAGMGSWGASGCLG